MKYKGARVQKLQKGNGQRKIKEPVPAPPRELREVTNSLSRTALNEDRLNAISVKVDGLYALIEQLVSERKNVAGFITEEQAQKLTGLSKSTLYKLRRSGQLSYSTFGSRDVHYKLSDIEALIEKNEKRL